MFRVYFKMNNAKIEANINFIPRRDFSGKLKRENSNSEVTHSCNKKRIIEGMMYFYPQNKSKSNRNRPPWTHGKYLDTLSYAIGILTYCELHKTLVQVV